MSINRTVRLGIIGGGQFARFVHFPTLRMLREHPPGDVKIEVAGIWNPDPASSERLATEFALGKPYPSLQAMLGDDSIEAWVLLVDPHALVEIVRCLVPTGKPIFTEKPPGSSLREAEELAELVSVPNLVAFNRRYSPLNARFKELVGGVDGSALLDCEFFRFNRLENEFLQHTGIHAINYIEYLFGPIREVTPRFADGPGTRQRVTSAELSLENGMRGHVRYVQNAGITCERMHVHAEGVTYSLHSAHYGSVDYPGSIIIYREGKVERTIEGPSDAPPWVHLGIVEEYREFVEAVAFGGPIRSTFVNAVNSMRVSEQLERAVAPSADFTQATVSRSTHSRPVSR